MNQNGEIFLDMDNQIVENFFISLRDIKNKYAKENIKEESFNIFKILHLEAKELIHSAFIAELLNPQGSHNKGDIFLRLFYEKLGVTFPEKGNIDVFKEFIIPDGSGRIDIYVKTSYGSSLIIENKIYANDQSQQLARYNEYDKQAVLLYLTLDGHEASKESLKSLKDDDYRRIDYGFFIILWLEDCLKKVKDNNLLYETFLQYLKMIKQLTGQTTSVQEKMDISKVIKANEENLEIALYLLNNQNAIYEQLEERLWSEIQKAAHDVGLECKKDKNLMLQYSKVTFITGFECNIILSPQSEHFNGLICGIIGNKNLIPLNKRMNIRNTYEAKFGIMNEAGPIAHRYWEAYKKWSNGDYKKILDGTFRSDLKNLLDDHKSFIESLYK